MSGEQPSSGKEGKEWLNIGSPKNTRNRPSDGLRRSQTADCVKRDTTRNRVQLGSFRSPVRPDS